MSTDGARYSGLPSKGIAASIEIMARLGMSLLLLSTSDMLSNYYLFGKRSIGGPGLAQSNTELTMPLNRRMALFAAFNIPANVRTVDEKVVADINANTILSATKQIYYSNLGFKWLDNEEIKSGRDLVN